MQLNLPAGGVRIISKPGPQGPDIQSTDSLPPLAELKMPSVDKDYNGQKEGSQRIPSVFQVLDRILKVDKKRNHWLSTTLLSESNPCTLVLCLLTCKQG